MLGDTCFFQVVPPAAYGDSVMTVFFLVTSAAMHTELFRQSAISAVCIVRMPSRTALIASSITVTAFCKAIPISLRAEMPSATSLIFPSAVSRRAIDRFLNYQEMLLLEMECR